MTVIRVLYEGEPDFPAAEAHPDAVRHQAGEFWVDALGGKPGCEEVDRLLADLGRLVYQRRREERERIARELLDRAKNTKGRGF